MRNRRSNKELDKIGTGLAINNLIQEGKLKADEAITLLDNIVCIDISKLSLKDIEAMLQMDKKDTVYQNPSELSQDIDEIYYAEEFMKVQKDFPESCTIRNKNPYLGEWYYYIHSHSEIDNTSMIISPLGHMESMMTSSLYESYERIQEEDLPIYDKVHLIGKYVDSLGMVLDCLPKSKYDK